MHKTSLNNVAGGFVLSGCNNICYRKYFVTGTPFLGTRLVFTALSPILDVAEN